MSKKNSVPLFVAALFVFGISVCAFAGTDSSENDVITFRGMPWESKVSDYKSMTLAEESKSGKYYTRSSDKLVINDADLDQIVYGFYKDRLFSVIIEFKGDMNFQRILEALNEKYGYGYQSNRFLKQYYWCLSCPTTVSLDYKEVLHKGRVFYSYHPVAKEIQQDSLQRAKEAGKDL